MIKSSLVLSFVGSGGKQDLDEHQNNSDCAAGYTTNDRDSFDSNSGRFVARWFYRLFVPGSYRSDEVIISYVRPILTKSYGMPA